MTATLRKFRVTDFRSVEDSGWITLDDVTALVGVNESGKTNLLLPLWKLNPASEGKIDLLQDAPRKRYAEIKAMERKPTFIRAQFDLDTEALSEFSSETSLPADTLRTVEVSKNFDGNIRFHFPDWEATDSVSKRLTTPAIIEAIRGLENLETPLQGDTTLKVRAIGILNEIKSNINSGPEDVSEQVLQDILEKSTDINRAKASKHSEIPALLTEFETAITALLAIIRAPSPSSNEFIRTSIMEKLPKFVYYSNYGNLDSEIYLPTVITNLKRTDLGPKESAKARTLRILFDFVRLTPNEIQELGKDLPVQTPGYSSSRAPTEEEIDEAADRKRERVVLLQSASSELTSKFREWWQQGEYVFDLQADGDHFRIWVADRQRPEKVELESRSTGLQWFLSFYLVFLVESRGNHQGNILLLDEPGLTLHPLSQRDLFNFFEQLASTNQIVYTTHSPFLIDSDKLDKVRSVFVNENGHTVCTDDLRASESDKNRTNSIFAAYAAIGLTTSDSFLLGCEAVIVEGVSDQYYLSAIKNFLIRCGKISPSKELVFIPTGGAKGVTSVVSLIGGREDDLPVVLVDDDGPGKNMANSLRNGLYVSNKERVLSTSMFSAIQDSEIEDIVGVELLSKAVDRLWRGRENDFDEVYDQSKPLVDEVKAFALSNGHMLEHGWKVELARQFKQRLANASNISVVPNERLETWTELIESIIDKRRA